MVSIPVNPVIEGKISSETESIELDLTAPPGVWLMQNTDLGQGCLDTDRTKVRSGFVIP